MTWIVFDFLKVKTASRYKSHPVFCRCDPSCSSHCDNGVWGLPRGKSLQLPLFMEEFLFLGFGPVKSRHGPLSLESPSEIFQLFEAGPWLCCQYCNSCAVMCSSAFSDLGWALSASSLFVALWTLLGNRGNKGYLTSTCPHAGFCRFSIYRSVKHSIMYTSELIQLFLAICCSCLLPRVLNFSCLRTRAAGRSWS